jgi:hypothetical protein
MSYNPRKDSAKKRGDKNVTIFNNTNIIKDSVMGTAGISTKESVVKGNQVMYNTSIPATSTHKSIIGSFNRKKTALCMPNVELPAKKKQTTQESAISNPMYNVPKTPIAQRSFQYNIGSSAIPLAEDVSDDEDDKSISAVHVKKNSLGEVSQFIKNMHEEIDSVFPNDQELLDIIVPDTQEDAQAEKTYNRLVDNSYEDEDFFNQLSQFVKDAKSDKNYLEEEIESIFKTKKPKPALEEVAVRSPAVVDHPKIIEDYSSQSSKITIENPEHNVYIIYVPDDVKLIVKPKKS